MLAMTVGLGEGRGYGSRFGQGWMKWSWHSFCLVSKWGPCLCGGAWAFCSPSVSPVLFYLACWLLSVRTPLLFCFPLFFLYRHKSLRLLVPEVWSVGMTFPFSILDVLYSFHLSIFKCHFPFFLPMGVRDGSSTYVSHFPYWDLLMTTTDSHLNSFLWVTKGSSNMVRFILHVGVSL